MEEKLKSWGESVSIYPKDVKLLPFLRYFRLLSEDGHSAFAVEVDDEVGNYDPMLPVRKM
jgi:hypothetical protein